MRIISGTRRGFKLKAPEGLDTRPTTDRIKESLFNILSPKLGGCLFLDLFAGSGGIGIEALSRGAAQAVFVDRGRKALEAVNYNLEKTGFKDRSLVLGCDFMAALKKTASMGLKFDVIFADPPYFSEKIENILDEIKKLGILNNEGIVVIEQAKEEAEITAKGYEVFRVKDYGKTTKISFLKLLEENEC